MQTMTAKTGDAVQSALRVAGEVARAGEVDPDRLAELERFYSGRIHHYGYDSQFNAVAKRLAEYCARYYDGAARRGLLLQGGVGTGKTFAMQLLARLHAVPMVSAVDLIDRYRDNRDAYASTIMPDFLDAGPLRAAYADLIVDDLGAEPTLNDFGTKFELLGRLIESRYNLFKSKGWKLHVTTNLDADEIAKRYGERVSSRLEEMCTRVAVTGPDRRRAATANETPVLIHE